MNERMNKMKATLNRFKSPAQREMSTNKKIIFKKNFLMFFFSFIEFTIKKLFMVKFRTLLVKRN